MSVFTPFIMVAGRVLISFMFIMSGLQKITGLEGTQGYMEMFGVPGILIYPTILVEVLGGLAVLLGYQARIGALLLAGFSVVSGVIFHFDPSNQAEMINLFKNLAIAGGFLFIVAEGPGKLSLQRGKS